LNEITDYLFNLLERQSLFEASEYLALKVLNESSCTINSDLAAQLETYRAMKKGNVAPNIDFKVNLKSPNAELKTLSEIKSPYTLVVFGASWCEACTKEVPKIATLYSKWKGKGVEVVFVSLDETNEAFEKEVSNDKKDGNDKGTANVKPNEPAKPPSSEPAKMPQKQGGIMHRKNIGRHTGKYRKYHSKYTHKYRKNS
jgi:thiol-disulfide isomerase/thioredoxin